MNYHQKTIKFEVLAELLLAFQHGSSLTPTSLVSSLSAMYLPDKGCQGFLAVA